MFILNKTNFFIHFQSMLEKFYLQPLDGSHKENLKNGFIERIIHGSQHSSSTVLWAFIMNKILENTVPKYVNDSRAKITKHFDLTSEQLLLATLMTMGCHDAARKGEGSDKWEGQSAKVALDILQELGLDENHAKCFAYAAQYKDNKFRYFQELKKLGILENDYEYFDYIRILISLGDNLDIIRCVSHFKSSSIINTLKDIKDFNPAHHEMIFELIKTIHQFIHDQHIMTYDCTILDLEDKPIVSLKSNFSRKDKVAIEHAGNVLSAVFAEAAKITMFTPFLNEFILPESNKYEGNVAFDPFIHGTNSSILSTLPKSEFKIMSPLEMIDEYQSVSMTGELTGGGYDSVGSGKVSDGIMGKTSFGILSASGDNAYTLEKIINYTKPHTQDNVDNIQKFRETVQYGCENAFPNINLLLIYLARARQSTNSLDDISPKEEIQTLREQLGATLQYFYFIQLLGTYIYPDFKKLDDIKNKLKIYDIDLKQAINKQLTFKNILDNIIKNKINMKEILDNPTPENLRRALSVLEFPDNFTFKDFWNSKEIILPINQLFCLEPISEDRIASCSHENFVKITSNYWPIQETLGNFISKQYTTSFFKDLGEKTEQIIIGFNDRIRLFDKLVTTPQSHFTDLQNFYSKEKFPIILVCEDETNMSMHTFEKSEFRSNCSLGLGEEIKLLATDTHEHCLLILEYLKTYHIDNVQVVLFDDLEKSKQSKQRPNPVYHHENNVQTLESVSPKHIHLNDSMFFQSDSKNNTNKETAVNLVQGEGARSICGSI